jgi:hypothetical protein
MCAIFSELGRCLGEIGIALKSLSLIHAPCLGYVEFSLADPQGLPT